MTVISTVLIASGVYVLFLAASPGLQEVLPHKTWTKPVVHAPGVVLSEDRLYIPKLQVNVTYKAGDKSVLNDNAWWRHDDRGNPEQGGNFILAAHRFEMGLTPGEVHRKSPFYRLDALTIGDKIYVDYKGTRYMYEVYNRYKVKPNDSSIEAPTNDAHMTLYSCTYRGSADGREVVVARLVQRDVDPTIQF